MSEFDYLNEEVEVDTTTPEGEVVEAQVWEVDGAQVSKAEFIRHQFTANNLSRKEISETFNIPYRSVYGATTNMVNDAEPTTRGRAAANIKIQITEANEVVTVVDGETFVNGAAVEVAPETTTVDRNEFIKAQVESGVSRKEIADLLGLSYGAVYSLTKSIAGASQRHEIEYEGQIVSRSEYIRILFAQGKSKGEIAKELEVDYPVVWSALKGLKSEQEKFADAVDRLAKFAASVVDEEAFLASLEALKAIEFKSEEVAEEATEAE